MITKMSGLTLRDTPISSHIRDRQTATSKKWLAYAADVPSGY